MELRGGGFWNATACCVGHQARVAGLAFMDLSPVNVGFQTVLKQMLSGTASIRPSATAFQGATYFQVSKNDMSHWLVFERQAVNLPQQGTACL